MAVVILLLLLLGVLLVLYQPMQLAVRLRSEQFAMKLEAMNAARAMLREAMCSWYRDR